MKRLSDNEVVLCGKGSCSCPTVTKLNNGLYEIIDDAGNKIVVSKQELEMMTDAATALDRPINEQLLCG